MLTTTWSVKIITQLFTKAAYVVLTSPIEEDTPPFRNSAPVVVACQSRCLLSSFAYCTELLLQ